MLARFHSKADQLLEFVIGHVFTGVFKELCFPGLAVGAGELFGDFSFGARFITGPAQVGEAGGGVVFANSRKCVGDFLLLLELITSATASSVAFDLLNFPQQLFDLYLVRFNVLAVLLDIAFDVADTALLFLQGVGEIVKGAETGLVIAVLGDAFFAGPWRPGVF